jgi:4-oxalocrotonate tautomerase
MLARDSQAAQGLRNGLPTAQFRSQEALPMPTIRVELFEGRTEEQKAALAAKLTAACVEAIGSSPDGVDVIFYDIKRHDWATGGVLWSAQSASKPAS